MKKFEYSLARVEQYKDHLLNHSKLEHSAILASIARQEKLILTLQQRASDTNRQLNEKNAKGISPTELIQYQNYLKTLNQQIRGEEKKRKELQALAEEKRLELVEKKKETASLEKLREKKQQEYLKSAKKVDELFMDEFVSNQRISQCAKR